MADGGVELRNQATARTNAPALRLPEHDVRRKRPPALSFLLRMETLRRVWRVVSLLLVDFLALYAAIFTALIIKAEVRGGPDLGAVLHETRRTVAFAYLISVLLFARSGLYGPRAERPGLPGIVGSLFSVTVVALLFALLSGQRFSS